MYESMDKDREQHEEEEDEDEEEEQRVFKEKEWKREAKKREDGRLWLTAATNRKCRSADEKKCGGGSSIIIINLS